VRFSGKLLLLALVAVIGAVAGCGGGGEGGAEGSAGGGAPGEGKTLKLGYIEWDENVANSNLIKMIAEEDLGYEEVELQLADVGPVFQGVANGDTDAFLDAWMPNHQTYLDGTGGDAVLLDEPWYLGETEYGIAVPDYMDVQSLENLDEYVDEITGIEPGALLMERIENEVIPQYDLNVELVASNTPAMLAALERAYRDEEPFAFLGWAPHWMNARYDFHYLEDPKDAMGELDEPAELHAVVRPGLEEDDPVAYALIEAMEFTKDEIDALQLEINEAGDAEEGARNWLEENRDVVEPWTEAASDAQQG
jgi:glycine betaine/proline transport system substrate-binding protein